MGGGGLRGHRPPGWTPFQEGLFGPACPVAGRSPGWWRGGPPVAPGHRTGRRGGEWWWWRCGEQPQLGCGPGLGVGGWGSWEQRIRAFFFLSAINLSGSWGGEQPGFWRPCCPGPLRLRPERHYNPRGRCGCGVRVGRGWGRGSSCRCNSVHTFSNKPELGSPHSPALCWC